MNTIFSNKYRAPFRDPPQVAVYNPADGGLARARLGEDAVFARLLELAVRGRSAG